MEKNKKQILVILPAYNNQEGLERTLKSLIPEREFCDVIVIDDGSKQAVDITRFPELSIKLHRFKANKGLVEALNFGLKYAIDNKYKYIGRIDAGDCAINGRFAKQLGFLEKNEDIGLVSSWYYIVTMDSKILRKLKSPTDPKQLAIRMHFINLIAHPAVLMRACAATKAGFYNEVPAAEDYDYWMRIKKITKIANYPDFLLEYEHNQDSISNRNLKKQKLSTLRIQLKYFEFLNIWSYLGVMRSLIILAMPQKLAKQVKKILAKLFNSHSSPY